jgi:NTP pyrophosphatase (non-canonical NTP hydrolase)
MTDASRTRHLGHAHPGDGPVPGCPGDPAEPRELLGRLVRQVWVQWAQEQPDPRPSWLLPWEDLDDGQKEADMRIGEALFSAGRLPDLTHAVVTWATQDTMRRDAAQLDGQLNLTDGHELARFQITRHGRDRYPTAYLQYIKLASETGELGDALLKHDPGYDGMEPEVMAHIRDEYADAGLALFELGNKLGLDLPECMQALVARDTRDFSEEAKP